MSGKQNCWEFKKCGRQPAGAHVDDMGVCPASVEERLDKVHGGERAGRACWVVVGTLCKSAVQGTFAAKINSCLDCDFYHAVRREEGTGFALAAVLMGHLKKTV
ncbi:MAG: hypothetical protein A2289_09255 [Deltaproteobacteria bacterium RIFOXYA12_FULL_58_15]|nr:MAG: hypothetical protein A2289_09255 [Deltaproteobacteria bacterium RIFOXYA12_FULL_58_15]